MVLLAHYMLVIYFGGSILSASGLVVLICHSLLERKHPSSAERGRETPQRTLGLGVFPLFRIVSTSSVREIKDCESQQSIRQLSSCQWC